MDSGTETAARTAVADLWRDGCPVAWPARTDETLALSWRRWRSFERRHRKGSEDFDARIEDLAKGLVAALEPDPKLVGPLIEDYRHLARTLGLVFTGAADGG